MPLLQCKPRCGWGRLCLYSPSPRSHESARGSAEPGLKNQTGSSYLLHHCIHFSFLGKILMFTFCFQKHSEHSWFIVWEFQHPEFLLPVAPADPHPRCLLPPCCLFMSHCGTRSCFQAWGVISIGGGLRVDSIRHLESPKFSFKELFHISGSFLKMHL